MAAETDVSGRSADKAPGSDPTYKANKGQQTNLSAPVPSTQAGAVSQQPGGQGFSRRELLRWAGILGAAVTLPGVGHRPRPQ